MTKCPLCDKEVMQLPQHIRQEHADDQQKTLSDRYVKG